MPKNSSGYGKPTLNFTEQNAVPTGRIEVFPEKISFGKIPGSIIAITSTILTLRNKGDSTLTINSLSIISEGEPDSSSNFSIVWSAHPPPKTIQIQAGGSFDLRIQLVAKELGWYQAALVIHSDDPDQAEVKVLLQAQRSMY